MRIIYIYIFFVGKKNILVNLPLNFMVRNGPVTSSNTWTDLRPWVLRVGCAFTWLRAPQSVGGHPDLGEDGRI